MIFQTQIKQSFLLDEIRPGILATKPANYQVSFIVNRTIKYNFTTRAPANN